MPVQSKPFTFFNNTTADANEVNADMDVLYALQAGAIDAANMDMTTLYQFQQFALAEIAAHPTSPVEGQFWRRSDLNMNFWRGTSVYPVTMDDDIGMAVFSDDFEGVNLKDCWKGVPTTSGSVSLVSAGRSQVDLVTGTTSGGAYFLGMYNGALYAIGSNGTLPITYHLRAQIKGALTNVLARFGMGTDNTSNGNNSFYFEFDPATDSHIRCVTKNGATAQSTNTTVTPVIDTDNDFSIEFKSGEVKFFIDGVVVATHSTQVPASAPVAPFKYITTTNTTSKTLRADKVKVEAKR